MITIPYIRIPHIGIGGIPSTQNIYPAQDDSSKVSPASPTPITYLTQWKIVGNSEVHGNEIWSCGEYNPIDGKYHILVQPLGGSIVDIALTEPLRKINSVVDIIEFPSETEEKALVTRPLKSVIIGNITPERDYTGTSGKFRFTIAKDAKALKNNATIGNILCAKYPTVTGQNNYQCINGVAGFNTNDICIYDKDHNSTVDDFKNANLDTEVIYELATPTTELVDAPQIEEAESYTMVISQGAKAVSWNNFETEVIP